VRIAESTLWKSRSGQDGRDIDGRGLQKTAAPAPFHPVDVPLVFFLHHETQRLAELQRAPDQRHDLFRRVLQQLEMRPDQIQRGPQVRVDLVILLAEPVASLEGHAPFGVAEKPEELHGHLVQPVENAVQLRGAELLHAAHRRDIAPQLLNR